MTRDSGSAGKGRLGALCSTTRFGKFVSVGAIGAAFDTAVLVVLVELFGVLEELAVLVGIEAAVLLMFFLNDNWTFASAGSTGRRSLFRRLIKSHAVRAGGILTQFVTFVVVYRVFFVSVEVYGIEGWLLVAKASGIGLGLLVNYTFETLFTWAVHADR